MSNISMMKRFTLVTMIAAVVFGIAGLIGSADAARKVCDDGTFPPCDGGGGDDGGAAPDFGYLIILYRDIDGVPIPSPETTATDPDGLPAPGGLCRQPIALIFPIQRTWRICAQRTAW